MNKLKLTPIVFVLVFLASCGKEPSEVQKAQLEPLLIGCSIKLNPTSLQDDNPIMTLAKLGTLTEFTNKKWSLSDDDEMITASFRGDTTSFECDFLRVNESEWKIEKVRRNGEEVYDRETAEAKRAELEAQKEAREEAERIEREKKKEEERLSTISKWREKDYSNVTYKYYAKYPNAWHEGMWSSPELRVICSPDYPVLQLDDNTIRLSGRTGVDFLFEKSDGTANKVTLNLTSEGNVGEAYESMFGIDVKHTEESNANAIKRLKASTRVTVSGMTFTMDDTTQIPCI